MENERQAVAIPEKPEAGLVQWAQTLQVTCKNDADGIMLKVKEIKSQRKRWWDYWTPLCSEADHHHANLVAKRKEGIDLADTIIKPAETKVLGWQQAERMKAAAAQAKLQAEADARARAEQERLTKAAEKLKTPELREARLEEAAAVAAPIVTITPQTVAITGVSTRTTWKAELVDMDALLAAAGPGSVAASFVAFDHTAADAFARATKGRTPVPGVRFLEVQSLSVRAQ